MTSMYDLFRAQQDSNPAPPIEKVEPLPTADVDGFTATELRVMDLIKRHGEPSRFFRHDAGCDYEWPKVQFRVRREARFVRMD